jgi:hypothetical protein
MDEATVPYREPGQRPKLSEAERRWFTRQGDVEKGPYAADVLARSVKSGVLKRTSLVRAEDETEWRAVHTVDVLMAEVKAPRGAGWTHDSRDAVAPEDVGSFGLGFAAGLFGGIIGLILVRLIAKGRETKNGVIAGFVTGAVLGILFRVMYAMGH